MSAIDNSRKGKQALAYDGHNRHPNKKRAMSWRRWRREQARWIREIVQSRGGSES